MLIKTLNLKPVLFYENIVIYYKIWKAWKECITLEETMDSGGKYHSHHGKHDDFHGSGREDTGRGRKPADVSIGLAVAARLRRLEICQCRRRIQKIPLGRD